MATRNAQPKTYSEMQRNIIRAQPSTTDEKQPFASGAFPDLDGSLVPLSGVHEAENYRVYPHGLVGRGGSELWGVQIPDGLDDNGPFSCVKIGDNILLTTFSRLYTSADLGRRQMVDSGRSYLIIEVISDRRIKVDDIYPEAASTAAKVVADMLAECRHEKYGAQIIQVGTKLYYAYTNPISSWVELTQKGNYAPIEEEGTMRPFGDDMAILLNGDPTNGGGIFKIDLEKLVYWKANTELPTTIITSIERTDTKIYGRRETYGMALLKGHTQNGQRYDTGVTIVHESGT
jgi:hypothetical protein